jgi:hypothetical protein
VITAALVPTTLVPAALIAARLVPTTLVPAALIAARLVPTALIASAVVAAGLLTGHLVPAALRLVVAAPVPAPPVTALRLARPALVPDTRLGVLTRALGWATRLLGSGLLGSGLLGSGLLSCDLLSGSLLGLAIRPVGHGRLVEAELLSPSVRADPVARAGAQARRGSVSDAGLRACVWSHSVLLPQAGRVSSRGRDTLVRTLASTRLLPGRSTLPGLNRLYELSLAHPAGPRYAHRLRDPLQLGHEQ